MAIIEFFQQYGSTYTELINNVFAKYNELGRPVLDFLHILFNGAFNILLGITIAISFILYIISISVIIKNMKKKDSAKDKEYDSEKLPFVTIQIPTYNELVALRCAKRCLDFDYPKEKYEILIGDDSSKADISRKIRDFAKKHDMIKVIKRPSNIGYKPGNLNNMLKYSKGNILVILDSDFAPPKDFLARIAKPFLKDNKLAGVQSRWSILNPNQNLISALGTTIVSTFHHVGIPFLYKSRKIAFFCGSAEAVRKDILIKLGGWDNGNLTEDIEFSMRLVKNGYKIEYLDDLECDSEVPYTLKDLYRQQMRWAHGVVSSYKKHLVDIVKSKYLSFKDKAYLGVMFFTGYFLTGLLAALFITGVLSFVTHAPAPVDFPLFFSRLLRNVALTSGLIFTSFVALAKANKLKLTLPMIASSFTFGLIVTYYVNVGIVKALAGIPMEWYMLKKQGNKIATD